MRRIKVDCRTLFPGCNEYYKNNSFLKITKKKIILWCNFYSKGIPPTCNHVCCRLCYHKDDLCDDNDLFLNITKFTKWSKDILEKEKIDD